LIFRYIDYTKIYVLFLFYIIGRKWRRERSEGPANFGWPQEGTPWREGKGREAGLGDIVEESGGH